MCLDAFRASSELFPNELARETCITLGNVDEVEEAEGRTS